MGISEDSDGYLIYRHGGLRNKKVHRVIMEQKLGRKLKQNEVVHHIDKNTRNNDPNNLEVKINKKHASEHGKEPKPQRKVLLPIDKLIGLYESGYPSTELAKIYKVSYQTILNRLKEANIDIRHCNNRPKYKVKN